ncbi:unnamed protein product [Didymodactylos carnosus]|uniref:Uncharacterized protein n=1 Tax=Didymodactylos carnosus TaxID=1234261 RepID=A0A815EF60_9BILA|nr:unnamed protein product [Didymodactylos carnosus]CAF4148223.1 unnamed protein product [Didymodactylos carnosus]
MSDRTSFLIERYQAQQQLSLVSDGYQKFDRSSVWSSGPIRNSAIHPQFGFQTSSTLQTTASSTTSSSTTSTTETTSTSTTTSTTPVCAVQIYNQSFTGGAIATSQCTAWNTFRTLLVCQTYSLLTLSGSLDTTGFSINDSAVVNNITTALRTNVTYGPITSNGHSWTVYFCAGGIEFSGNGECNCGSTYTIRPCISTSQWGGINDGTSCTASSQTMSVTVQ